LLERRPASFYFDPGVPDVFTRPYRPYLVNLAGPQTYTDIWGDWYGVFAWNHGKEAKPPAATHGWLSVQSVVGLLPTLLAVAGWLVLLLQALRRRLADRLLVGLLPLAGIAGYLFFTVSYPTPDGDVLKPTYMLSTVGAWALCFGWLADCLRARSPQLVAAGLGVLAALVLPFVVYKGAVGWF